MGLWGSWVALLAPFPLSQSLAGHLPMEAFTPDEMIAKADKLEARGKACLEKANALRLAASVLGRGTSTKPTAATSREVPVLDGLERLDAIDAIHQVLSAVEDHSLHLDEIVRSLEMGGRVTPKTTVRYALSQGKRDGRFDAGSRRGYWKLAKADSNTTAHDTSQDDDEEASDDFP